MDHIYLILLIVLIVIVVIWSKRRDEEKNGKLTSTDRKYTFLYGLLILVLQLALAYLYFPAYLFVAGPFIAYVFLVGAGTGKRGTYRQARDGGIVASIIVLPIAVYLYMQS